MAEILWIGMIESALSYNVALKSLIIWRTNIFHNFHVNLIFHNFHWATKLSVGTIPSVLLHPIWLRTVRDCPPQCMRAPLMDSNVLDLTALHYASYNGIPDIQDLSTGCLHVSWMSVKRWNLGRWMFIKCEREKCAKDLGSTISGSRHNRPPPQALCNTSPHIRPSSGDRTKH